MKLITGKSDTKTVKSRVLESVSSAIVATAFYGALWAALCGMGGIGTAGVRTLLPGGALTAAFAVCGRSKRRWTVLVGGVLVLLTLLLDWDAVLDGWMLLVNRYFAASAEREAYVYDFFSVETGGRSVAALLRRGLLPLGLASGLLCGAGTGRVAASVAFAGWCAYLGVTPGIWTLTALCGALVLTGLRGQGGVLRCGTVFAALGLIVAAVLLWFPGEDAALSKWEANARDRLAFQTAPRETLPEEKIPVEPVPETENVSTGEEAVFYREEETPAAVGGDALDLLRPLKAGVVILFFAALLFVPAVFSDCVKRKRERNREGLSDSDPGRAIRASLPYAFRWLRLGGLEPGNEPYSACGDSLGALYSLELQASFEAALPLWQEAVYSEHVMNESQRETVRAFTAAAQNAVWERLPKRRRFLARYFYAL